MNKRLALGIRLDGAFYGDGANRRMLPFDRPIRFAVIGYDTSLVLNLFKEYHQSG